MRACQWCKASIVYKNAGARYCSTRCRVAAHRAGIPAELIRRDRWIRRTTAKRPITVDGRPASSTDPATWAGHAAAKTSRAGVGLGFVLGDGVGCIDLDHCLQGGTLTAAAARFLADYPDHWIEVSPSGDGLHIWGTADPAPGTRRVVDGLSVERYSDGRYITVTGRTFQHGALLPV